MVRGGAGKTTIAVSLFHFLSKGHTPNIQMIDCDVEEPNDLLFFHEAEADSEHHATQLIPVKDNDKCTYCRKCVGYCEFNNLEEGGLFYILDFSEFDMNAMPFHHRAIFKAVECNYAFDYIGRDWKSILRKHGFQDFTEHFYLRKYMRLFEAVK